MTVGPGDEAAAGAGGHSHLRASHADREQAIDVLKAAFVQGRLAKDEFDLRVGQVLASRTYADLAPSSLTSLLGWSVRSRRRCQPSRHWAMHRRPRTSRRASVRSLRRPCSEALHG